MLPFSDRRVQPSLPTSLAGAQYNFGLRDIAGKRYNPICPPNTPSPTPAQGVFVSGPFTIDGAPEIIRLDADITGDVDRYLICRPSDIDTPVMQLHPGTAVSGCLRTARRLRRLPRWAYLLGFFVLYF